MRRTKTFTITDRGVDKTFEVKEMDALSLELWTLRALKMLLATDILGTVDVDKIQSSADMPGIVSEIILKNGFSSLSKVNFVEFQQLQAEMLATCSIVQENGFKMLLTTQTIQGNIDDYRTIGKIVFEVVKFNLNFSLPGEQTQSQSKPTTKPTGKRSISVQS